MSDPEIGVNSTDDILKELLAVAKNIQGLLSEKTDQESRVTQQIDGTSHESDDQPEVENSSTAQVPLNNDTVIVEIVNDKNWPNDETLARYRDRCAKHKSKCQKMQVELGCFISHLGMVGGGKEEIDKAGLLRKGLLDPVQCLEKAFDVTPDGRPDAMQKVQCSFYGLDDFVRDFARSPHQKDALYLDKIKQWFRLFRNGWSKIYDLVRDGKFDVCLEFIHDELFSELESAMGGVVEALTTFEEKSVSEWLAAQKIEDLENCCEEYISRFFPPEVQAWSEPEPENISRFGKHLKAFEKSCNKMQEELDHLKSHYSIVGGDKAVVEASHLLQDMLLEPVRCLKQITCSAERLETTTAAIASFARLHLALDCFQKSLYHQKHAFYFRKVKKWVACVRDALPKLLANCHDMDRFVGYICDEFLLDLNSTMVGASEGLEKSKTTANKSVMVDSGNVVEELKTFGNESLPKFLVDQTERDTTRYVNLTTIATFFSSVTATTLQFTYAETDSVPSNSLRGVVNLFWFLSLVFSVSSGVNSLLGLTWRKSSIYDTRVPPTLILMWLDKAPMLFLIIATVAFVIGLNLFAYLSLQPRYVSFATNILTGLHVVCMLAVTAWFIYQLKHNSIWAKWIAKVLQWIGGFRVWKCIGKVWKWVGNAWKWIKDLEFWRWIRHPRQQYREKKLHLRRNFFWAFGIDNRVPRLNNEIDWDRDWPEPYLLSKLIRYIAYPIKKCWLMTKKALFDLSRTVRVHACVSSPTEHTGYDVEMGENARQEEAEAPESPAKNEFRTFLQTVFSEAERVDRIMSTVDDWDDEIMDNDPFAEQAFRRRLWGYPDLVQKLFEVVGPALVKERDTKRREKEEREKQDMADEHAGHYNAYFAPEIEGLPVDVDDNTAVPTPLVFGTKVVTLTKTDTQPDSHVQVHHSTSDERAPLTTSATTEVLEFTSEDLLPQPDIEEGFTLPLEIEEVESMSANSHEG